MQTKGAESHQHNDLKKMAVDNVLLKSYITRKIIDSN